MKILHFIAFMLVLIFIALAWRFLLPLLGICVGLLMWYLLFVFVIGMIKGFIEIAKNESERAK
jgi:Ca2+/Na+ antiporter